jgi:hypothetical protein
MMQARTGISTMTDLETRWRKFWESIKPAFGVRNLTEPEWKEFMRFKKAQGQLIDPEDCEVFKLMTVSDDPYQMFPEDEPRGCYYRSLFARNKGSANIVDFDDLSKEVLKRLNTRLDAETARRDAKEQARRYEEWVKRLEAKENRWEEREAMRLELERANYEWDR